MRAYVMHIEMTDVVVPVGSNIRNLVFFNGYFLKSKGDCCNKRTFVLLMFAHWSKKFSCHIRGYGLHYPHCSPSDVFFCQLCMQRETKIGTGMKLPTAFTQECPDVIEGHHPRSMVQTPLKKVNNSQIDHRINIHLDISSPA